MLPGVDFTVVTCLFSCITAAKFDAYKLPLDSVVVAYDEYSAYHGTLSTHPVSCPVVKVNKDPKTYIEMLLSGSETNKRRAAKAIVTRRDEMVFSSVAELR